MGTHTLTIRSAGLLALATAAVTLTGPEGAAAAAPAAGTAPVAAVPVAAAVADRSGGVSVTPAAPAPGTDIALRITGCAEHTAVAASDAFVADALLAGADGTLAGETRVRSSVRPGKYDVEVLCGAADMRFKGALTVGAAAVFPAALSTSSAAASAASAASASATASASAAPAAPSAPVTPAASAAPASPVAPVRAGGGGTADLVAVDGVAAVDETDGSGAGSGASGAGTARSLTVLVLAGAAAAAVALRCSRRRREAD